MIDIQGVEEMEVKRVAAFAYGVGCYVGFLLVFAYAVAFVADFWVPRTIDSGPVLSTWQALSIDVGLIALFGVQHSVMARERFKRWWTRLVPAPIERSTYVLFSSLALVVLFVFWRPIPQVVWDVEPVWGRWLLWGIFALGWVVVVVSTELLDSRQLFGLRQVWNYLRDREPAEPSFRTPGLYRWVRHPLMSGFLISFWATPTMTVGHLTFSIGMTAYILVGTTIEERDLLRQFGDRYRRYREEVPMLIPGFGSTDGSSAGEPGSSKAAD
jgi:protein-S-isoprenylcysteine O-methyltransferase Ste14